MPDGRLDVTCFTDVEAPTTGVSNIKGSQFSSKSVDCKMVDATRVAQQLKVSTNSSVECADINRAAIMVARKLLPAKSLKRYEAKGRGFCFLKDTQVFWNIGPLWVQSEIALNETKECLQVTSTSLPSPISSPIFPGNHYCKLLSPSAALDWMMTDSHKPFPYPAAEEEIATVEIQI